MNALAQSQKFLLSLLAALLMTGLIGGCALLPATRTEQEAQEATPTPIPTAPVALKPTYKVQRGEVVKEMTFSGRISPVVEKDLYFRTNGRVRNVFFKRNEEVKEGDIIADFEIEPLERELVAAELELERAQVMLDEARRNFELDRRLAQTQVEIAQIQLDGMRNDINTTSTAIALQEKQVAMAQISFDRLGDDVNPLLKNDVTRAQYAVDKLKQTIAESQIAAPFSGKLLSISLIPGQEVQGYKAVVSLADVSQLEVSADLFSDQLNELAESMPVSLTLSSAPGKPLSGQVRLMPYPYGSGGKSTDETQTTDKSVRISINQTAQEAGYELGDLVRVTVEIERKDNALWLPPQAIRNFNGRRFAVLQDNDVQRRVDVKVGIEAEDRVEIEEGLEEGQTIVGP